MDTILDYDPNGSVACETTVITGIVNVMGEVSTNCYVDIPKIVRQTIKEIGYTNAKFGFDSENCAGVISIDEQSTDIAMGVDKGIESKDEEQTRIESIGAGYQGMMFGFATNETEEYMPLAILLAYKLAKILTEIGVVTAKRGFYALRHTLPKRRYIGCFGPPKKVC